ncbi:mobilization protein [uncultured Campylobacter sp.]|uniref:mobilization protein n=1 Tax=uncultured Campylobacter sp. TaxID=218934 RepID=UPI002637EC28|nr:mobilization protein [uncultured Campylobacter sp.]
MSVIASINFKKSNVIQTRHNDRTLAPSYLISDSGCKCNRSHEIAIKLKKQIIENAKEAYKTSCKARNKKFQATSYEWSAVCNIKSNTTMQDLENLAKHFEDKYGFQCYQIAIHRDEGHIDDNGNKAINHHAHLEFITLDKATGKNCFKLRDFPKSKMREIQDEVAEILKMERGQDKRISKRERIEPRKYAQMKEAERKKTKKLKTRLENLEEENKDLNRENNDFYYKNIDLEDEIQAKNQEIQELNAKIEAKNQELEQEKLSKNQLEKLIKEERKAMIQKNKELEEANQQKIYNADDYKRLRAIKEQQDITIQELNKQIEQIKKEAKEREENLRNVIQAKDQENEALKAENNEIKAQKYTLTQEQIQEIINQALAQKNAEIEQKNQEIQSLKAKNLEYFGQNDKLSSHNQYLQSEVDRLNKKIRDYDYTDNETEISEQYQEEDQEQEQNNNKSKTNIRRY